MPRRASRPRPRTIRAMSAEQPDIAANRERQRELYGAPLGERVRRLTGGAGDHPGAARRRRSGSARRCSASWSAARRVKIGDPAVLARLHGARRAVCPRAGARRPGARPAGPAAVDDVALGRPELAPGAASAPPRTPPRWPRRRRGPDAAVPPQRPGPARRPARPSPTADDALRGVAAPARLVAAAAALGAGRSRRSPRCSARPRAGRCGERGPGPAMRLFTALWPPPEAVAALSGSVAGLGAGRRRRPGGRPRRSAGTSRWPSTARTTPDGGRRAAGASARPGPPAAAAAGRAAPAAFTGVLWARVRDGRPRGRRRAEGSGRARRRRPGRAFTARPDAGPAQQRTDPGTVRTRLPDLPAARLAGALRGAARGEPGAAGSGLGLRARCTGSRWAYDRRWTCVSRSGRVDGRRAGARW